MAKRLPKKANKFDIRKLLAVLKKEHSEVCIIGDAASPRSLAPERITTGAINLDWATGGGIPTGRITELYSRKESEGKSTLAVIVMREAQKNGALCMYLDTEEVTVKARLVALGVDMDNLFYDQPESAEQALSMADKFITEARAMGHDKDVVVVIDSIAAMNTDAQVEGEYGKAHVATLARVLSAGMRKINQTVSQHNAVLLATNQVRERIGISYGDTLITPGGKALKFYASLRIELKSKAKIYKTDSGEKKAIGITVTATVKKSKVGMPFQTADLDILFATGLDPTSASFRFALQRGLIERESAGVYSFNGIKGDFKQAGFGKFLEEHPDAEKLIMEDFDKSLNEVSNTAALAVDPEDDEPDGDDDDE